MNEARFSFNHKLPSGDMVTVRGDDFETWRTDIALARSMDREGETTVLLIDGYAVQKTKDGDLRVYFYRDGGKYKELTAYDNHFPKLPFKPGDAKVQLPGLAKSDREVVDEAGAFIPCQLRVTAKANPKAGEEFQPTWHFVSAEYAGEPPAVDHYQEIIDNLDWVTTPDRKLQALKRADDLAKEGKLTFEQVNELKKLMDAKLAGSF